MAQITYIRTPDEDEESGNHPLLANLLRGVGGLASGTVAWMPGLGSLAGSAIGGAVESGAQRLEGSPQDLKRIGVEAAIGAFPYGKVFKVGRMAASALGGGATAGFGEAGREWSRGEELNPKSIATSAGIGAATGGTLAGILGKMGKLGLGGKPKVAVPPPPKLTTPPVITEEIGNKVFRVPTDASARVEPLLPPVQAKARDTIYGSLSKSLPKIPGAKEDLASLDKAIQQTQKEATAARGKSFREDVYAQKAEQAADKASLDREPLRNPTPKEYQDILNKQALAAETEPLSKVEADQLRLEELKRFLGGADEAARVPPVPEPSIPQAPSVAKAPDLYDEYLNSLPKGPQPFEMEGVRYEPNAMGSHKAVPPKVTPLEELLTPKPPVAEQATTSAFPLRHGVENYTADEISELDVLGTTYGNIREIIDDLAAKGKFGEAKVLAAELRAKGIGKRMQQIDRSVAARLSAVKPGAVSPEVGAVPPIVEPPTASQPLATTPSAYDITDAGRAQTAPMRAASLAAKKAKADSIVKTVAPDGVVEYRKAGLSSQKGEANPFLLARLALGGTGAAVGAATGETPEEKLGYAALGGALGAGIPSIPGLVSKLQNVGFSAPEAVTHGSLAKQLTTKEGISKLANKLYTDIPEYFRSNLLFSKNIFANAIGGPVSSGYLSAADYAAAGDPRGIKFLKEFKLDSLKDELFAAYKEAGTLSHEAERAGGTFVGEHKGAWKEIYGFPGRAMTTGDSFIRKRLMAAGFTDKEARTMTLTAEPKWNINKQIVNITRSGPVGRMVLPFSRTATNIVERGTEALPGIGFLAHKAVGSEIPKTVQAMQQLSGTAIAAAAEQIGENVDPYSPNIKMWRNAISNLGGTKSMQAAAGFAVGQARRMGKIPPLNTARGAAGGTKTALANMFKGMPLPSMSAPTSVINSLLSDTPIEKPPQGLLPTLGVEAYQEARDLLRRSGQGGTGTTGSAILYKRSPD